MVSSSQGTEWFSTNVVSHSTAGDLWRLCIGNEWYLKLHNPLGECTLKEFSNITSCVNHTITHLIYDWENHEGVRVNCTVMQIKN